MREWVSGSTLLRKKQPPSLTPLPKSLRDLNAIRKVRSLGLSFIPLFEFQTGPEEVISMNMQFHLDSSFSTSQTSPWASWTTYAATALEISLQAVSCQ